MLMAALSYAVRALDPGSLLNMHLADFPQYILLFIGGVLSARRDWLPRLPSSVAVSAAGPKRNWSLSCSTFDSNRVKNLSSVLSA